MIPRNQYTWNLGVPICRVLTLPPEMIPDPCDIIYAKLVAQEPLGSAFPVGTYGDITVAVDPFGLYTSSADFPANQFEEPLFLKSLVQMETMHGSSVFQGGELIHPVRYRKSQGDKILVAPEGTPGNGIAQLYLCIGWRDNEDIPLQAGTEVFSIALDSDSSASAPVALRNVVSCPPACSEVRVRVSSRDSACVVNRASIGVRNGTSPNTTATPVELTFNTLTGFLLAPFSRRWSDWVPLPKAAGDQFLVHFDLQSPNPNNRWAFKFSGVAGDNSYSGTAPSSNLITLPGASAETVGRTHIVDRVEVR